MTELARPEVVLGGDWNPLDRAIRSASAALTRAGARMEAAGARLSTRLTLPLAAIGVAVTKATADWETAMVGVQKTVDATQDELDRLGDSFIRMSERIPVASGGLADIAAEAGQLGIATRNLEGFVQTIAALRVATNLGEEAGSSLARLANIMGTSQTEFDRMGSTIVDLGNNLATTEAELTDMALRIAGAGRQIGLSEAQVLAFAGALSSVGIRAEAGGTAISRVMVEIATAVESGGNALNNFAAVAGMSAGDFRQSFETDAAGAIVAFIAGLGRLEEQGGSTFRALEELGLADVRVRDVLLRTSGAADILSDALHRGETAWSENTALARESSLFFERLAARFTILRNKAGNIAAELGNALRPAIDRVLVIAHRLLNVVRGLVDWFAQLSPQLRTQIAMWVGIAAALGPVLVALGTAVTLFGNVLAIVASVGTVLIGLVAIIVAVKNNWLGLGEAGARAWDTIVTAASAAVGGILNFIKPFANFLIGFFVGTARAAYLSWDIIRYEFVRAFEKIRDFARPVLAGIATALGYLGKIGRIAAFEIQQALSAGADEGEEGGTNIGRRIAKGFSDAFATDYVGAFVNIVQTGIDKVRSLIERAIAKLKELASAGDAIPELEEAVTVLEDLGDTLTDTGDHAAGAFSIMTEGIEQLKLASVDFAIEFADTIGDAVIDGIDAFKRFGEYVLRTLARIAARLVIFKALSAIFPGSQFIANLGSSLGFAGGFQHGGTIPAGKWGIVGERGPEKVFGPATVEPIRESRPTELKFEFPPMRSPTDLARDQDIVRMIVEVIQNAQDQGYDFAT